MIDPLLDALKDHRAYFLIGSWWSLTPSVMALTVKQYRSCAQKFKNHNYIYLCNEPEYVDLLKGFGIPAFFCHQNAMLDEHTFTIKRDVKKVFDSIYNANVYKNKRHYLAYLIKKLGLIYYCSELNEGKNLTGLKKMLPHAAFLNYDPVAKEHIFLDASAICEYYNQAHVGLALSAIEGAMYASAEYLLCGLPVVSTHSKGGRDVFFDDEYCRVVPPDAIAVRDAVYKLIDEKIDPIYIRNKTIEKMRIHRKILIDIVQGIYNIEGIQRNFQDEWNTVYINKMLDTWMTPQTILEYILRNIGHKGAITTPLYYNYKNSTRSVAHKGSWMPGS